MNSRIERIVRTIEFASLSTGISTQVWATLDFIMDYFRKLACAMRFLPSMCLKPISSSKREIGKKYLS